MMFYDTVETGEDEIIIESDRVYSTKLGTGIATIENPIHNIPTMNMNIANFVIDIKYKRGHQRIDRKYKNEIDLHNKLNELEQFLIKVKKCYNDPRPIFAFNCLIKPSEIVSVSATVRELNISEERKYIEKGLTKDEIDILESSDIEWFPENITDSTYDIRVFSEDEYEKVLQLLGRK